MRKIRTLLLALAVAGTALIGMPSASAHGVCTARSTVPIWDEPTRYWNWTGVVQCAEAHPDNYQASCLESVLASGAAGRWDPVWCSDWHHRADSVRTFSWPYQPWSYRVCAPLHVYRTVMYASVGNGGAHWDIPVAYSAPSPPCGT